MPKFGVMLQLLPRRVGDPDTPDRLVLHSVIYDNPDDAQAYIDMARRQNLPFKGKWIIQFEDPRDDN